MATKKVTVTLDEAQSTGGDLTAEERAWADGVLGIDTQGGAAA